MQPRIQLWVKERLPLAIWGLLGIAIGVVAWGSGRVPMLAAILPMVIAIAPSRGRAVAIAMGYVFATTRGMPAFTATWFENNLFVGYALWLTLGIVAGLAWSIAWTSSRKAWRKALAVLIAWTVTLLPPVALVSPGHVVIAWGYITPGWTWIGVALSAIVPATAIWLVYEKKFPMRYVGSAMLAVGCALVGSSFFAPKFENRYFNDLVAVSTRWGAATDPEEMLDRVMRMGKTTRALSEDHAASVVIFPESIVQTYYPSLYRILKEEILLDAAGAGQTVVIGADLPLANGSKQSSAIAFYPDGTSSTALARQPVPVALWRPWTTKDYFEANWSNSNILQLQPGIKARVVFCFEEYMPILSLINEALHDHQMVLVMANTWAGSDQTSADIQTRHSEGLALLFGKKLLKAENRPKVKRSSPQSAPT